MRVRISFDALRLCLLVAAGVTSGYLWRAAFESSSPAEQRLAAAQQRVIEPAPTPPVVHIAPRHLTLPARHPVVTRRVVRRPVVRTVRRAAPTPVVVPIAVKPTHVTPRPTPQSTPPKPPAPPAVTTTPPPTQTATPPPVQAAAAPPPATTTTAATPPPPTQASNGDESKPGWGKGDKNHDHDGPGKKP